MVQPEKKKKKDRDGASVTEHPARARCAIEVQKVKFLAQEMPGTARVNQTRTEGAREMLFMVMSCLVCYSHSSDNSHAAKIICFG